MSVNDLESRILEILAGRRKLTLQPENLVRAAVLVPIIRRSGEYCILFMKRPKNMKHHPGQISFPGGIFEERDLTLKGTVIREMHEELGVDVGDIKFLGELDDYATTTGFLISPFVGSIPYPYNFKVNKEEVADLIIVPVEELTSPPNVGYIVREGKHYPVYYYELTEHIIWGATARILKNFMDTIFSGAST
ncbi:MAG: CoA pyrophosphatase [Candidatus Bathyarchaeia archaeon]